MLPPPPERGLGALGLDDVGLGALGLDVLGREVGLALGLGALGLVLGLGPVGLGAL